MAVYRYFCSYFPQELIFSAPGLPHSSCSRHKKQCHQVGWTCVRQRAAVLRPTEVGPHAAAARIQCRFCASMADMSDDFGMIEAVLLRVPDGHGVRGCGQVVGLGFLVCHRHDQAWSVNHVFWKNVLWSRRISENIGGMECLVPLRSRAGVCQLFVVEFWASNPHRSNRTERGYNRTIVISAAW